MIGLTLLGHVLAAILGGGLILAGIFYMDGTPGAVLVVCGVLVALLGLGLMEWRTYRERSGPAFPGDRNYRGR